MRRPNYLAVLVASCLALTIPGCSRGGDTPVYTSAGEFEENLAEVERVSRPVFEKAERGEPIGEHDKSELRAAIRIFRGLYAYRPNMYTFPFAIGKAYQLMDDDVQAMKFFNETAELIETSTDAAARATLAETNYLAVDSLIRLGKYEDALEAARRAVMLNGRSANYNAALASAYLQLRQEKDAEESLKRALELEPGNRRALALAKLYAWGKALR